MKLCESSLLLCMLLSKVAADILVFSEDIHRIEIELKDIPSKFGSSIPIDGIKGLLVYSNPANACSPIEGPPNWENHTGGWIVLIKRYGCNFDTKVRAAQAAGYIAAIVHNVNSSDLEPMSSINPQGIHIPSVFISDESGYILKDNYQYDDGYYILINDDLPFDINTHLLLPFAIVVGFCVFIVVVFMIVKYIKDRRRQRRHRLPNSALKKIPIHKFKKGDPYEICAICLEDYVDNDKLRVLPCSHAYHSKCIDPWLTKNRRVCPVCKRKVLAAGETIRDTESETDDETAPLVRSNVTPINSGTFVPQRENPIQRARRHLTRGRSSSSSSAWSTESSNTSSPSGTNNSYHSIRAAAQQQTNEREEEEEDNGGNLIEDHSINSGPVIVTSTNERDRSQDGFIV